MCDILFQDKALTSLFWMVEWSNKSGVAIFCCFSQFSALSTEKFYRGASSWQHELFTVDVDRQYELNGIDLILPGKCAHV